MDTEYTGHRGHTALDGTHSAVKGGYWGVQTKGVPGAPYGMDMSAVNNKTLDLRNTQLLGDN